MGFNILKSAAHAGNNLVDMIRKRLCSEPRTRANLEDRERGEEDKENEDSEEYDDDWDYQTNLCKATLRGDWKVAKKIFKNHPDCFTEQLRSHGGHKDMGTALQWAVMARQAKFVEKALKTLQKHNREIPKEQITAIAISAMTVNALEAVTALKKFDSYGFESLADGLRGAASLGQEETVMYSLPRCLRFLDRDDRIYLLLETIQSELYEAALMILERDETLALECSEDENKWTPLDALARRTESLNTSSQSKHQAKLQLMERVCDVLKRSAKEHYLRIMEETKPILIFVVIESGNYDLFAILIRHFPLLLFYRAEDNEGTFSVAIKNRQEKIFGHMINQLRGITSFLTLLSTTDANKNNVLHLAAIIPPPERLAAISGPAFQMQRELLWFKLVEELAPRRMRDGKNKDGETPRILFTEEHKGLRMEGEKWMRKTADSCMIVATLVAAGAFQAAFQPPNNDHKNDNTFAVKYGIFIVSNALSLLGSAGSMLAFLSILTSRYEERDFLTSLPLKLAFGLIFLFVAIMAMLVAFSITVGIIFPHMIVWVPVAVLAWLLGGTYIWRNCPLLLNTYFSIRGTHYFFQPRQDILQY